MNQLINDKILQTIKNINSSRTIENQKQMETVMSTNGDDLITEEIIRIIEMQPEILTADAKRQMARLVEERIKLLSAAKNSLNKGVELDILFNYQEKYLKLIREYKEEVKFLNTAQEDLRKERAKFFSNTLQEVSESLKNSNIDEQTTFSWTQQLVNSFTKSIDVSQELVDARVIDTVEKIKSSSSKILSDIDVALE